MPALIGAAVAAMLAIAVLIWGGKKLSASSRSKKRF
jgi:hypothetical protein